MYVVSTANLHKYCLIKKISRKHNNDIIKGFHHITGFLCVHRIWYQWCSFWAKWGQSCRRGSHEIKSPWITPATLAWGGEGLAWHQYPSVLHCHENGQQGCHDDGLPWKPSLHYDYQATGQQGSLHKGPVMEYFGVFLGVWLNNLTAKQ